MKKNLLKFGIGILALAALVGCGDGKNSNSNGSSQNTDPSSEEPVVLTKEEFDIAVNEIANKVPLALDIVTGNPVLTNKAREVEGLPIPELKDGNNLKLIKSGTLHYEDEENEVYLYPDYTISWSFWDHETLAKFDFEDQDAFMVAVPDYPRYLDGETPPAKKAVLYATVHIGDRSERLRIDVVLMPQALLEEYTIREIRSEAIAKQVLKVKGYVHGILDDWNSAGIADGEWGLGLYRTEVSFKNAFKVGDLVEVVGEWSVYNGLAQIQQIKEIKILNPENYPLIKKPTLKTYTMDELLETVAESYPGDPPTNVLFGRDNSIVTFDAPLRFLRVEDRDGKDVGFAGFDTTGAKHTNVILQGTDSTGYKFETILSINYHMGSANQIAFRDWLQANQTTDIYYRGALSAYNKLVLGPYEFAGHLANTPFTA